MVELRRRRKETVSLAEVVQTAAAAARARTVRGYILSATQATWVELRDGVLVPTPSLEKTFEARLFDGTQEWRWLREGDSGVAAWVGEVDERTEPPEGWQEVGDVRPVVKHLDHRLLLWGRALARGTERDPTWSRLGTPRIGPRDVPVALAEGRSAVLVVREYLAVVDEYGNVGPWEERLLGIEEARVVA